MPETRSDKFVRLVESRVPKALTSIRLVGQLASPNYEFTKEQAEAVVGTLQSSVDDLREAYGLPALVLAEKPEPLNASDAEAGNPPETA